MNMIFVICAVSGVTILACQTALSILGFGESRDFSDGEIDLSLDSVGEHDWEKVGGQAVIALHDIESSSALDIKSAKSTLNRVRAIGLAMTFFGLMGSAAEASQFSKLQTFASAFLAAIISYMGAVLLLRQTAILLFDETVSRNEAIEYEAAQVEDDNLTDVTEPAAVESNA